MSEKSLAQMTHRELLRTKQRARAAYLASTGAVRLMWSDVGKRATEELERRSVNADEHVVAQLHSPEEPIGPVPGGNCVRQDS